MTIHARTARAVTGTTVTAVAMPSGEPVSALAAGTANSEHY